jgi:hypothetical protein
MAVLRMRMIPFVVYLRLRTVSIRLTSKVLVLDVLDVLDVAGGGGSDLPPVGISPAKIEADSAHMSASAIANRFMDVAPFEVEKMPKFLHKKERAKNGTTTQDFLQGRLERITIPFAFAQLLANRKSQISCGLPLRSWTRLT